MISIKPQRTKHELVFFPAALDICLNTAFADWRAITWSINVLFAMAILGGLRVLCGYLCCGARTYRAERLHQAHATTGDWYVRAAHVRDGQSVNRDVLIEFATTSTEADEVRITYDYAAAQTMLVA